MIYAFPKSGRPLRQGDIFAGIPRASVSLSRLTIVDDEGFRKCSWDDVAGQEKGVEAVLPVTPVYAIVATQNCDAQNSADITLCEISNFRAIEGKAKDVKEAKSWVKIITQHARINQKWFYLPPDKKIGFREKRAVDFRRTIRVPREDLENFRGFRKGTLNAVARLHFRERIGQFFKRYPYNEWYALTTEELNAYERIHKCTASPKYPWQAAQ